jgi:PAS domain S-box-containing protein
MSGATKMRDKMAEMCELVGRGGPEAPDAMEGAANPSVSLREANEKLVLAALHAQELLESAEAFRLLVESVDDYAIFVLDTGGRVAKWNAGAQRLYGYAADEILGRPLSALYTRKSTDAGECELHLGDARRTGRSESEGTRVRKDGTEFWASVIVASLRDEAGRHVGFATATRDLTERIRAERERLQLSRAEEAERRKDEFLAIMGHELRNPLAPMVTALHLIKSRGGQNCERELGILERQLQHMVRLVDDLLDVSRMVGDKVALSPEVTEIGDVLANAVDVSAPLIEGKGHRLRLDVPAQGLLVNVDRERMIQVFANLLNNAAKYTEPGGGIGVRAASREDLVEVTVEDTGVGFAPDLLPRLFDLFTQGEQGIERHRGGLGIGLAIARRLVHEHGGRISARSDGPGHGSCFTVTMPRTKAPLPDQAMPPAPLSKVAERRRVLIVDDNRDAAETMRTLVETLGHETHVAFDGSTAVEVALEVNPDIVFLDLGLPGLNGFEVVRRLRQVPSLARIPIIAVTGYARDADRRLTLGSGFSDHFAKPVDIERLRQAVEMAK